MCGCKFVQLCAYIRGKAEQRTVGGKGTVVRGKVRWRQGTVKGKTRSQVARLQCRSLGARHGRGQGTIAGTKTWFEAKHGHWGKALSEAMHGRRGQSMVGGEAWLRRQGMEMGKADAVAASCHKRGPTIALGLPRHGPGAARPTPGQWNCPQDLIPGPDPGTRSWDPPGSSPGRVGKGYPSFQT